jgi:hypothetical protein
VVLPGHLSLARPARGRAPRLATVPA